LCETDHRAVLEACREVLALASKGDLKPGRYNVQWRPPDPAVSRLPKVLLDLAPSYIVIDSSGYLTLEMHGGFDHFGLRAYPKDFKEPHPDFNYGHRKLMDGLWYYDEEYTYDKMYGKRIDGWLKQCGRG
jgi:hypothetical protein